LKKIVVTADNGEGLQFLSVIKILHVIKIICEMKLYSFSGANKSFIQQLSENIKLENLQK